MRKENLEGYTAVGPFTTSFRKRRESSSLTRNAATHSDVSKTCVRMLVCMSPAGLFGKDQVALSMALASGRSKERGTDKLHWEFKFRACTAQSRLVENELTNAAEKGSMSEITRCKG